MITRAIPEPTTLMRLVDLVRLHLDARRRAGPCWKFRLAPDLLMSIQPYLPKKPGEKLTFNCEAYEGAGVTVDVFSDVTRDFRGVTFELRPDAAGWALQVRRRMGLRSEREESLQIWRRLGGFPITDEARAEATAAERALREKSEAASSAMADRIVAAIEAGFFDRLRPADMLGTSCTICGRGLTDPISRARFIGPECWGSSSADIPWLMDLQKLEPALN